MVNSTKLAYVDLLAAICILANAAKGVSALQLARDIGCHAKTGWILAHKIRQALGAEADGIILDGVVEVDGAIFSGSIRPANKAEDRIDRRLAEHQTGSAGSWSSRASARAARALLSSSMRATAWRSFALW